MRKPEERSLSKRYRKAGRVRGGKDVASVAGRLRLPFDRGEPPDRLENPPACGIHEVVEDLRRRHEPLGEERLEAVLAKERGHFGVPSGAVRRPFRRMIRGSRPRIRAVRLYIVRHGESRGNLAGTLQGSRVDEPLSPRGIRQAEALSTRLSAEPIDAAFASPMIRARETAEIVSAPHGLPIAFDTDLLEFDWGVWCGRPLDDAMEREVAAIRARWRAGDLEAAPADGESPAAAGRRAARFLERLSGLQATHALVVAHGRFNRILMATLLSRPLSRMDEIRQRNGSLSTFDWNGRGSVTPVLLDDVGHIPPDLRSTAGGSDSLK